MIFPTNIQTDLPKHTDLSSLCLKLSRMSKPSSGKFNEEQLRVVGWPAYLSENNPGLYEKLALTNNSYYWKIFHPIYEDVLTNLTMFFNERIYLSHFLAIPGYHVIRNTPEFPKYYGGVAHTDIPHLNTPLLADLPIGVEQYSFTLLLSKNAANIGINFWNDDLSEEDARKVSPSTFIPYTFGEITIFSSNLVHRIAPFEQQYERITLQGHIIRYQKKLIAYW